MFKTWMDGFFLFLQFNFTNPKTLLTVGCTQEYITMIEIPLLKNINQRNANNTIAL